MIIFWLITFVISIISFIFYPFPTITEIPWGVDSFLVNGVGYFKALMEFFPPLSTVFSAFMIYIGFRVSIIVLRFFFGSRAPTHD